MTRTKVILCYFLLFLISSVFEFQGIFCNGLDIIMPGQYLSGNQTLSSQNGTFQLGFFSPNDTGKNYYIGIWYTASLPEKVVVWVANRDQPVSNPSLSQLRHLQDGNLVLLNRSNSRIWSTNSTTGMANSTVVQLLDSGNLVVGEASNLTNNIVWQSFDYPTNHWLPGGRIGYDKLRNLKQKLTSWRSQTNPAPSPFSVEVEENGTSHLLLWNETKVYWSSGDWDGRIFESVPEIALNFYIKNLRYVDNENESYFTYDSGFPGALTRFLIDSTGQLKQFAWRRDFTSWNLFWTRPTQQCEVYAYCGAFSSCSNIQTPICKCLPGYEPRDRESWDSGDHMHGCTRTRPSLSCDGVGGHDSFSMLMHIGFDPNGALVLPLIESGDDCRLACLRNCTCTAHAYDDNRCLHWIGDILNVRQLSPEDKTGKSIYVRIAASDESDGRKSKNKNVWIVAGATTGFCIIVIIMIVIVVLITIWRRKPKTTTPMDDSLMAFKYKDLRLATNNFSEKLGQGGFGSVFKGMLPNSRAIAVKRFKESINQDRSQEKQFRAEVSTIGTIQHVNLVRLRGFCTKGLKRFLILDYMENGSLDSKLFPKDSVACLSWKIRYEIAIGTARGLTYLHEKCRDCIVHCDIKPENILLDAEFNPRIADFGLAKLIGREFSRVLTTIRGTRGYLAPEWISGEPITPKADVFSYGMLLMEIVSGQRNRDQFSPSECDGYFPAVLAERINKGEDVMSLLDQRLEGKADAEEVSRVCRVAAWCIQDEEKNRPSMGHVVQILEGLSEVGVYPIPRFLHGFVGGDFLPIAFFETSSSG